MSSQIGADQPETVAFSAVQIRVGRNSAPESRKSSPFKNVDVADSPKKRGMKSAEISSANPAKQSLPSCLPSPFKRADIDWQDGEARGKETLDCERTVDLREAPRSPRLHSEFPLDPVSPDESTNVLDEANEVSCPPTMENAVEVVPSLQTVTLESWHAESRGEDKIHSPSTSMKLQNSEKATISNDILKDTSLCRKFEDVALSNPEEDPKSAVAAEGHDRAISTSASSPSPSACSPSLVGAAETKTDAKGLRGTSTESFENIDEEQFGDRNPELFGDRRLTSIKLTTNDPDSCVFRESESIHPDSSRSEVDQETITALSCNANASSKDRELAMKDHDPSGKRGIILVTNDSPTTDEIPATRENESPTPSAHVAPRLKALDAPELVAENTRVTRSGSRFSEETNMLRDFLSRAQAQKAARDVPASTEVPSVATPRRSPRKPLAEIHNEFPSPEPPLPVSKRPGTPPGKAQLEMGELDALDELDELDEADQQTSSCRRSTRTRLFTPARPAPGAPSLIPVRRTEGGDPVRLPRSSAQELATVTRSNTRRNRGQSKPPKLVLQSLPVEPLTVAVIRPTGEGCGKSVGWDATLVYYQATSGVAPGKDRRRRKRNGPVEAPGEGSDRVGLTKETTGASTANARLGSHGRGRNQKS